MEKLLTDGSLIPIMMITWNRLEYTKQAINAILENTKHPFTLWIWDNGSTDGTVEYLKSIKDSRITTIFPPVNEGLVPPMNHFFDWYSKAKYVSKVDNDTIVPEGWLIKLKYVMDKLPLFVIQSDHYLGLPYKLKNNQQFYNELEKLEFEEENLYLFPHVSGTGVLIRRKHIDKPIEKKEGTLSGWVDYQYQKARTENRRCAFYSGVWVDRLDFIGTNKIKCDYPEYLKEINKMRSGKEDNNGFGKIDLPLELLEEVKESMKIRWR